MLSVERIMKRLKTGSVSLRYGYWAELRDNLFIIYDDDDFVIYETEDKVLMREYIKDLLA